MSKSIFEKFITKYNLNGTAESVILVAGKNDTSAKFISDDKSVIGSVEFKTGLLPEGQYPIYNTESFAKLLSVLGETLNISVDKKNEKAYALLLKDDKTKVRFMLSDEATIPKVPPLKGNIPMNLTFTLDDSIMSAFIRGKAAMGETAETFTVVYNPKETVKVVLGNASDKVDSDSIIWEVDAEILDASPLKLSFKAEYLKSIFVANKDAKEAKLSISAKGLAKVEFKTQEYTATYGLVQVETGE